MRIIISGGAGFIGSHLCEYLLKKGNQVVCIDNLLTGKKENLKEIINKKEFELIEHDITHSIELSGNIDWVFHLASPASPVDYYKHPIHTLKVGSLGTHIMLGIAKRYKAKFLLASTSEVYGDPEVNPQPEEYWGHVNTIGPRGVYDESKRFAEAITMAYHNKHKIKTHIARIFNTYGPRMRLDDGRAVPNFIYQALKNIPITIYGDGTQTRSFCYITDQIQGIVKLMESNYSLPINIGNPSEITILEIAKLLKKMCSSKSILTYHPLPKDDPKKRKPDITKAIKILKWEPKIDLIEGLEKTIEYFKNKI